MDESKLLQAIDEIVSGLRGDVEKLNRKCDAVADVVKKSDAARKADEAGARDRGVDTSMRRRGDEDEDADPVGEQRNAARRTAADHRSDSIDPAAFSALVSTVADMKKKQSRPMGDLNAYADAQSKADAVMRAHAERAEPPIDRKSVV